MSEESKKVWKIETGPSKSERACSRGPESTYFEILQNSDQ